jgi:hypothetical protein
MRRISIFLILLALVVAGGWWSSQQGFSGWDSLQNYVENGEVSTLEVRFSPEQIMEANKEELLTGGRTFGESSLKYRPFLLMDVKFTLPGQKTRESKVLWSLADGEMVLNTDTWETTHGFEDAINAEATGDDFKILNALAQNKGALTKERLQKAIRVDVDEFEPMLESARGKHLVTIKGNEVQLHFENPKLLVTPQTKISQALVSKPYSHDQMQGKRYSRGQLERITKAAFGADFKIRTAKEIYLPIYSIRVVNPDGSILTTFWNAINGQRMAH